jgi:hypothetical protein
MSHRPVRLSGSTLRLSLIQYFQSQENLWLGTASALGYEINAALWSEQTACTLLDLLFAHHQWIGTVICDLIGTGLRGGRHNLKMQPRNKCQEDGIGSKEGLEEAMLMCTPH